jgi:two-component system chemotaxis sensor kinase CheA
MLSQKKLQALAELFIEKGRKVGIDDYEIKLDREKLMKVIRKKLNLTK